MNEFHILKNVENAVKMKNETHKVEPNSMMAHFILADWEII